MNEEVIIEKILGGHTHYFSEIVDSYKDRITNMVYNFTGDYGEAQDLSQEVFINIFRNLKSFGGSCKLSTWIYRITYNLCIDWVRKNRKKLKQQVSVDSGEELVADREGVEEDFIRRQNEVMLRKEIRKLDDKYRNVVILFHFQGLSYDEIGEILKLPPRTVETRLYRARNKLKGNLSRYLYGGELYEMQAGS